MKEKISKIAVFLSVAVMVTMFTSCANTTKPLPSATPSTEMLQDETEAPVEEKSSYSSSSTASTFTNAYGTATTLCAHSGCANRIASSGDTNCCSTHSNRCAECGKYIDEDASWCMSCLENAAYSGNSNESDYNDDSSYQNNLEDIADVYDMSPEEVDAKIQAVIDAMGY